MNKIAFIGLGNMGSGMARNLCEKGYAVTAFDLSEAAMQLAQANGCTLASNAAQAVQDVDLVLTMLPAGQHVLSVYQNDVLPNVKPGTLLVDCSTIEVASAKQVAQLAADKQLVMADAPVSGGTKGAADGTLTFMVGAQQDLFRQIEPVLSAMGKKVVRAGESGAGQAAKICNNMLLAASMIATCEAFKLAEKLELDAQTFFDIAANASGQTWSMTSYCPIPGVGPQSPADNEFQGGFASALMLKDLNLAMSAAEQVDAQTPMGELAQQLYQKWCEQDHSKMDFSSIIKSL